MRRLRLMMRPRHGPLWAVLNLVPPGLGALVLGWRNPHTRLRRNGALQLALVVAGSWPLVVPGLAGLAWAIFDALRIARAEPLPRPPPTGGPAVRA